MLRAMVQQAPDEAPRESGWRAPGDTPAPTTGQRLSRALRLLLGAVTLVFYFTQAPVGYAAFMVLALLPTRDPARRARTLQAIFRVAFSGLHHWLRWTRILRFDPRHVGGEPLPDGPCVLVANHPTLTDVTAIMASFGGVSTIVKSSLYRRWWLRPLLASAGQFESVPGDPLALADALAAASQQLAAGSRVLIFPEGTRSPGGVTGRFGRTPFELACRADVPIVPIVIRCEPVYLGKGGGPLRMPYRVPRMTLRVLASVTPKDYDGDSRALKGAIEAAYKLRLPRAAPPDQTGTLEA